MIKSIHILAMGFTALFTASAVAGAPSVKIEKGDDKEKSTFDRIWELPVLYKNKENPVLQEFSLKGRLHLQYGFGDSDVGSYDSSDRPDELTWGGIEVRRWRLGFKSLWFHQFKLEGQIDVNPEWDPEFYSQIYDLNLTWAPNDAINIGVGKYKANLFGTDHGISSNEILTIERSLLGNAIFPGELTGIRVNGKANGFVYGASVYAGDIEREFTEDADGYVAQAQFGYDFKKQTGLKKALVKLDYQYGSDAANGAGGGLFEHAFSLNGQFAAEKWALNVEGIVATGRGLQGDVWGFNIIPSYNITDKLQAVVRYQHAEGDADGLRLQSRYERLAPLLTDGGRGDQYDAIYMGLNYYIYGHKLKLMAGAEYHNMDGGGDGGDFDGWTGTVALRFSF